MGKQNVKKNGETNILTNGEKGTGSAGNRKRGRLLGGWQR